MDAFMIKLFNMSLTAVWLILAVIVLRLLLKKAPKYTNLVMWAFVGFRLICPISFESVLSLIPVSEPIPNDIQSSSFPYVDTGINTVNNAVNPVISKITKKPFEAGMNPLDIIFIVSLYLWISGIAVMLLYSVISYLKLIRKVKISIPYEDNIYLCDNIKTPFILGIMKPKIYLPSDITIQQMQSVISHEKAHIKRCDHIWKPLGFAILSIHWFNPFVWLAYTLFCRDIEFACDEKVIKNMKAEDKKAYSESLLSLSIPNRSLNACPLAFGEVGVKSRIKSVLNYKKPALWIIIIAVVALIAVAVGFMTTPANQSIDGIHYIDKYYYDHVIGEERANNEMRDTKYSIDPEMTVVRMNDSGVSTLGTLVKWVDMNEYELNLIFDKLPITYTRNGIKNVYEASLELTDKYIFIMFKNGDFIGAYLPMSSDGNLYTMQVFKLKKDPNDTVEAMSEFGDFYIPGTTTNEKVTIGITEMNLRHSPYIVAKWDNNTGDTLTYGSDYHIYRYENGEKVDCNILENRVWNAMLYSLLNGSTEARKFSLEGYDLSIPGIYSLEFNFGLENEEDSQYTAVLEFEIADTPATQKQVPTSDPAIQPEIETATTNSEQSTAAYSADTFEDLNPSFDAKVLEVNENNILVEPVEGEDERRSASKIYVSTNFISEISVPEIKKGDKVRIVYNGEIQETFPAQISKVYAIYPMEDGT